MGRTIIKGKKEISQMKTGNGVNKSLTNISKNTSSNGGKSMVEELRNSANKYAILEEVEDGAYEEKYEEIWKAVVENVLKTKCFTLQK